MNWIFGAYSSVYNTAMLNTQERDGHVAGANRTRKPRLGLFGRR
jgi:hypothetical protein